MSKQDFIKKSVLLGLGMLSYTDKGIEKAIRSLEKSKHIKAGEGEKLIKDITAQVKKQRKELANYVKEEIRKGVKETRLELSKLEKKLGKK